MRPAEVRTVARASRAIGGWFSREAAQLFGLLDEAQRAAGVAGDLFEIGVHHGRSAVLLCHMARGDERVAVCDIFGAQEHNASRSGLGNRAIFERNISAYAPAARDLVIFEKQSSEMTPAEIGSPYRFFHVDGGHLAEEALGDLQLASHVLHELGVIVLDDPFKPEWPGVTEALLQFLDERQDLVPVALGFNKLVICRRASRPMYDQALLKPWDYFDSRVWEAKDLPLAGSHIHIFMIPTYRQVEGLDRWVARARSLRASMQSRVESIVPGRR